MELPKITIQVIDLTAKYETKKAQIGQNLELQIQAHPTDTPYDYEVVKILAKSTDNNTTVPLIDENGCPVDITIFPALERITTTESNMLRAKFHAFKFSDDSIVSFDVRIRFCLFKCPKRICSSNLIVGKIERPKRQSNHTQMNIDSLTVQIRNPLYVSSFTEQQQEQEQKDHWRTVNGNDATKKQVLDIELPLNYKLYVHGPHRYADSADTMIYGENGGVLFVSESGMYVWTKGIYILSVT